MRSLTYLFLVSALFFFKTGYAQQTVDDNKSKMAAVLENYFDLEREAIHVHLDKTSFITNEKIWYQGYIVNRKTNKPYFTTNVFIVLYDEKGNQLSEKLIFASNGIFFGKINLSPTMHSGNYYIQAYTNWMNNFNENESTITKVNIINPSEGVKDSKKINPETLEIYLNPEGKKIISGISNTIGIQVKDCRGIAPENFEVSLQNTKGDVLRTFKLNKFGLGKFDITPTDEPLKVILNFNDKIYEKQIPNPEPIGFALNVNNFTIDGKTIIKIKTNPATLNSIADKKFYLLIHQDQKYSIFDIRLNDEAEQTISVNNTDLFEGINTIRIIDSEMKEWNERLLYVYPKTENQVTITNSGKNNGKINLKGQSTFQNSNMSISVLPEDTHSWDENNSIIAGITLNPYLKERLPQADYYFKALGRAKSYELDLALLNQEKSKYDWAFMKATVPTANYSFDIGIDLKGTIDASIPNKNYHKVKLVSFKDFVMMASDVSEKGEYHFEHILLADSTFVKMSLEKLPNFDIIKSKLIPQVMNRKKPFYKPFSANIPEFCPEIKTESFLANFDIPKFSSNTILLKEVKVIVPTKKKMTYESKMGNWNLRGYKVDDAMERQDLLVFIEANGFNVVRNGLNVTVYSRQVQTLRAAQSTPEITIDGRQIRNHDELNTISMAEIDEIYLNPHAIVASMNNNQGIIRIYTKKSLPTYIQKQDPNSFYIKDGFARYTNFKNADYENSLSEGFDNFGLIYWSPIITTDETGGFTFDITDYNKAKGRIIIEGMTPEGQLFQEEKIIDLN